MVPQRKLADDRTPAEVIEAKTHGVIDAALKCLEEDWRVGEGARNLADQATVEYHDRFLIELIQNAHDAHRRNRTDGRIEILLDRAEGAHGVLYVANGGRPFTRSNFRSISEIGVSDKPLGEGIGHKGIGFKSVLQICRRPEIFSAIQEDGLSASFGGFCFSFAERGDLLRLLGGDEERAAAVASQTAPFHLPVPLMEQNATIRRFAALGMATVVRLPLDSLASLDAVERQITALRSVEAPLLLFLDRLATLVIETRPANEAGGRSQLRRKVTPLRDLHSGGLHLEEIDLGEQGSYLRGTVPIDPEQLRSVVRSSVEAHELDKRWADWHEEVAVSVAVQLDAADVRPRMYSFLPTEMESPFRGHLNAPFYTSIDRRHVNEDLPFNGLLLDVAALACAKAALLLRSVGQDRFRLPVVDLVGWRAGYAKRLVEAFGTLRQPLRSADVVPIVPLRDKRSWGALEDIFRWDDTDMRCLTSAALARDAAVEVLLNELGNDRFERLAELHLHVLGTDMRPGPEAVAEWAEHIAGAMKTRNLPARYWDGLYDDLAYRLGPNGRVLQGRAVVLDEHGTVRRAGRAGEDETSARGPTVFFPPVRERTEGVIDLDTSDDVTIPRSLQQRFVYSHPELTWIEQDGSRRTRKASRKFFEEHRLIQEFETRTLLEHVRDLLARSESKKIREDALRWTYRLQRTRGYDQRPALRELNLRVPTRAGWMRAQEAFFSARWPGTEGNSLEKLIERTQAISEEVAALASRLLLPPDEWPFPINRPDEWVDFLRKLGVQDGLRPVPVAPRGLSEVGWAFRPDRLGRQLSLGESERALWVKAVEENADWPAYPGSRYRLQRPFYRLPGQSDYQKFPGRARRVFARLVVAGMGRWEPEHFAASFRRTDVSWRNFDDRRWPTPLVAFLKGEQWLPIRNGQDGEEAQFARPIDAWHFRDASPYDKGEYARPDYVPLIPLELRRIIDRDAEVFSRLRGFGLNVWNDPADAGTVVRYLGQAVARGEIGETSVASVRKAYEQAWANVVGERLTDPFGEGGEASFLLVDRAGRLEAVKIGQDADGATETVFIRDDAGRLVNALISAGGNAILDIGGANGAAVAGILAARQAAVVRLTSSVQIGVVADGELIDPGAAAGELLVDGELEWLAVLLALVLEFKAGPFRHVTERMRQQAVDVSRRIRLVRASMIAVRMDGHDRPPPSGMRAAVPLPHDDYPTIVFTVDDPVLTWRGLEALAPALAELIGYTDLVDAFRTTIMDLSRTGSTDLVTSPTDEELARALGESETRIREIERSLRGSAAVLRDELRPVIYCLAGPDAADRFSERTAGADSEQALIAALADYRLPREPEALLTLWRDLGSRDAVRTELGISFGDFNRALQAMGESPIHYEEEHRQAFAGFVAEVRERIVGALRLAYWDAFLGQQPLNGYVELRERVSEIAPDPAWLDEWERPDRTLMETRVNGWLRHAGAAPLSAYHDQLPSFDAVRRANRETVAALVRQLLRVVPVWCRKHNLATPEAWTTAEGAQQRIGDMLFAAGALDFEALTDGDIIAWLARIGAWPVGMVPTADPDALGLSEEDLHREQSDAERERARREEERRSIQLGGRRYSAEQSNYIELAKAARAGITGGFLRSPKAQTRLGSPSPPRRHDPSTSGLGRSIRRLETDLQKSAIGLVGEVLALEWLKRNYATASDDSWKSTYRDIVLGGQLGDDSLGYDFEVALKTTTYLFEVKATSGERLEIELGESEVLAARKYSQSDRYRIIFIPNALVPNLRSLHVLPNPFGRLGREFYRIVGSGLRYTFLLTE